MRLVVAHENLDFDALGSLLLAKRLFPGAVGVLVGGLEGRLKEVVALHEDHLGLLPASAVDLLQVREVIVVDTARADRIGPIGELVGKVPFQVYDHHPRTPQDLPAAGGVVEAVGSTVSLLMPMLVAQGLELSPLEATLAYAGIWEDTGGFSYPGTTAQDLQAAAQLLRQGAEPERVREWVRERYGPEARELLSQLLRQSRVEERHGFRLLIAAAKEEGYVPALAPLAHTLLDLYDSAGVLMELELGKETLFIARSRERLDVGGWLAEVGGGGHARAAFAKVEGPLEPTEQLLLSRLEAHLAAGPTLRERMSRPVAVLPEGLTVAQALEELRLRGFGGMPVVAAAALAHTRLEEGPAVRVYGIARRRDLERALRHGLGEAPVRGVLSRAVILPPQTPLHEAEQALKSGAGRVLVGEPLGDDLYRLEGIFTRTDLYRAPPPGPRGNLAQQVWERLPRGVQEVLERIQQAYPEGGIYVVGGTVRDALLGMGGPDLDLVLEPLTVFASQSNHRRNRLDELARQLVGWFGGSFGLHVAFGTARVKLGFGLEVDLAEAREEYYPHPGALPQVRPSSIARDLERRDFTVNALALRLSPRLEIVDLFDGLADLEARLLRPLHPLSFVEDPSRILRGVRLAARLGFRFAPEALAQIPSALQPEVLAQASKSRLRDELLLTLGEASATRALGLLAELGVAEPMFGMGASPQVREAFAALEPILQTTSDPEAAVAARLYLLLYFHPDPEGFLTRYNLPRRYAEGLRHLRFPPEDPDDIRKFVGLPEAFRALHPERALWLLTPRRMLMGRDLLEMGLPSGPKIGEVLRKVAEARLRGEVLSYEDELEFARKLVSDA